MATLAEAKWMMVSRKQFAEWCVAALRMHEQGYSESTGRHERNWAISTRMADVPEEWQTIVCCLLTSGYSEVWDWCAEQGVELGQSGSAT